ncbi:hypothetical protein PsorP6_007854 [Peronosclerospora sorghi]|uniref:Uncharacterized protein n=1 Tax=Peronosclerospora sorghi TaxID=230839 RepID=A0ACC0WBK4_9STRA|nr:hypothetical protein PsorP6_007854 [Peronosclerospora sorghi]
MHYHRIKSFFGRNPRMVASTVRRFLYASSTQLPSKHKGKKNHFTTAGLPLVLFVVGGYVALTQFMGGKYEAKDHMIKSQTEHVFNLEEEHKKITAKLRLDDFELKPVPPLQESFDKADTR